MESPGKEDEKMNHETKKNQRKKIFFPMIVLFILTVLIIVGALFYVRVSIGINQGSIGYCMQDEKLLVSWQTISDKNRYRFSRYEEESGEYIFCGEYAGGRAELTDITPGQELTLKMQGVRTLHIFGYDREIMGKARILTVMPEKIACPVLTKTADLEKQCVTITWDTEPGDKYEIYRMNGAGASELYAESEAGEIVFSMEDHAELAGREQEIGVAVRTVRHTGDYMLYSSLSDPIVINRVDLMDDEVYLSYEENGELQYNLNWRESKSDWYELQEWSFEDQEWISRQVYQWSDSLSYDTGRLPSGSKVRFRVITYDDTGERDRGEYTTEPSEVIFRPPISPIYCTIWPLTALAVSEDPAGENVTGQVPAGTTLCVLEEAEGRFLVRYEEQYGYIDSQYCLIDLAEYLGNLCQYNITNSYSSIFRVHGYEIPEVTDSVIAGYENIHMKDGRMLVPYLYPCAQRLYQAALRAEEDGYVLCIYDAFRPNEATRYLYDATEVILDQPVPEIEDEEDDAGEETVADKETDGTEKTAQSQKDVQEKIVEDKVEIQEKESGMDNADGSTITLSDLEVTEEMMEKVMLSLEELAPESIESIRGLSEEGLTIFYVFPQESLAAIGSAMPGNQDEYGIVADGAATDSASVVSLLTPEDLLLLQGMAAEDIPVLKEMPWEEVLVLKWYLDNTMTYRGVMTDNRFRLGSFLAQAVSTHNRGIALDLTLVRADSEEELLMQSDMHDLSWYSIPAQNNENADLLASYMEGEGYHGLSSEWWHFQDDETRNRLQLGYLEKGVSPEGWKKDALGWKYRLADGSYYYAVTVMIDNKECTFNEGGYLVEK